MAPEVISGASKILALPLARGRPGALHRLGLVDARQLRAVEVAQSSPQFGEPMTVKEMELVIVRAHRPFSFCPITGHLENHAFAAAL